jgi:hypothetical protein
MKLDVVTGHNIDINVVHLTVGWALVPLRVLMHVLERFAWNVEHAFLLVVEEHQHEDKHYLKVDDPLENEFEPCKCIDY